MSLAGPSPWRTVEHDGDRFMVRQNDSATWIVRLDAERETYLFEGDATPVWARGESQPRQAVLL